MRTVIILTLLFLFPVSAQLQVRQPQPTPLPPPIPAPQDRPYPGTLRVQVDATDLNHRVFTVRETIPIAAPGPTILLYPQWLPGEHAPNGPVHELAGLVLHANGTRLEWTRDPVNMFAFHVTVPTGAKAIDADFQWLTPVTPAVGHVTMSPEILDLEWNAVLLYPAGFFSRDIQVEAALRLPHEWQLATALETASTSGDLTRFKPAPLNTLIDSPVYAGHHLKRFDLDPGGPARVSLDVFADRDDQIAPSEQALAAHRALVQQAYKLYGSHHYAHYDFLFSLSDTLGGNGLEHHQSSEDGTTPDYFTDWSGSVPERDLLPHEYTHSWNGKFRRPADLWTANFNVPMRDSLLWVYEGQTQYWGQVLAARSGLWTLQEALDSLAETAATYDARVGRTWRQLADTTNDPIVANRRSQSWRTWQRSEDYYSEGQLIWLDADTLIREKSGGTKSLDDFARRFFGIEDGSYVTQTYTFEDVVNTLNAVLPYDWASFLRTRLEGHGPGAPLEGVARGGYRLVYTDAPSEVTKASARRGKYLDMTFSIGTNVRHDGTLTAVQWDGPAFKAGLTDGVKIIAVNGTAYSEEDLTSAVRSKAPLRLTVQSAARVWEATMDYRDGLRYPHLERIGATPARIDQIFTAK